MTSNTDRRCGVGIRGVAMAIDSIVWIALFMVVVSAVGFVSGDLQTTSEGIETNLEGGPAVVGLALWLAVSICYHTVLEWRWGKTVGKYLVSITVTRPDGSPPSFLGSLLRNLFRLIDWLPFVYLVGIVTIAVSKSDRRLGDRVGNTIVIRT
ncbi:MULTISPECIES: RDD family protein [unclassified Halorhabdus]|uniref:RDD family protein n=1 Tax=unclassified Halorhabdus TaxID=2621901 RepID=UPI0023DB7FAE|nr:MULTISPECIES: RDD family protein [unclassified Halorhabdus]WEL18976.1 putative membrane protein YckC, RDD family [Halorhabdus sp. SVX81]WEL22805.1 putative membrane protein YckC, RDD family [Halorhabdus sp. BNX81]